MPAEIFARSFKDKLACPSQTKTLWQTTGPEKMELQIKRRRWVWLSYTLRKPNTNTTKQALRWSPQGKLKKASQGKDHDSQWRGDEGGRLQLETAGEAVTRKRGMEKRPYRPTPPRFTLSDLHVAYPGLGSGFYLP